MGSGCMYSHSALGCVDARAPLRATYMNLYRWPESDAEFVKSVSSGEQRRRTQRQYQYQYRSHAHPMVVDSYSCRQMYLRSYTFSKKETVPERTRKCLGRVKEKVVAVAVSARGVPRCLPWGPGDGADSDDRTVRVAPSGGSGVRNKVKKKQQKKRCLVMRRLREVTAKQKQHPHLLKSPKAAAAAGFHN
ncbi:hypothetical protein Taro_026344 [Colocasia esculenta]|uniref:Uncharacterized protein n=1 Tax=Colocasia esculenta TaxID=4460 RepID=A0A843VEY6_COLES|nr:hypothetical protein [Colocasia esculenta]